MKKTEVTPKAELVTSVPPPTVARRFPECLLDELTITRSQNGSGYVVMTEAGNPYALPIGSRALNSIIRDIGLRDGKILRRNDLNDINTMLQSAAESKAEQKDVWYRVAPIEGGIEVDPGDDSHARIRITSVGHQIIEAGSTTLFYRHPNMLSMAIPVKGDE